MAVASEEWMLPQWSVRSMSAEDVPRVHEIEVASYPFPWSAGIFRDCLRAGYGCFVLELDEQMAGYAILSLAADEAHVLNICIHPQQRCRGLGRKLMQFLFAEALRRGARDLFLEVRPSNLAAIRLYQSLGLQQVGLRRGYYQASQGREDALVLRVDLGRISLGGSSRRIF
jgi:[ribosomal protein S18]-alanine N-acetyltransferase